MAVTRTSLNDAQESFILASMDYLLEFPSDPTSLNKTIRQLVAYLDNKNIPDIPDDIKQLCQFIQTPQNAFYRLDQQNKTNITIADVKNHVIELVTKHINQSEIKAKTKTPWDKDYILKTQIVGEDHETILTSQNKQLNEPTTIWEQRANNPEKIYSFHIDFKEDERSIKVTFKINTPNHSESSNTFMITDVDPFYFMDEVSIYMIAHRIEILVIVNSIKHIEQCLAEKQIINDTLSQIQPMSYAAELLTDKYYLSQLLNEKIRLHQILQVDKEDQYTTLIKPAIKKLIMENIIRFSYALILSTDEVNLISHPTYLPLFLNRTLNIHDITISQCRLLIAPCIAQLISSDKLPVEIALQIPYYLKPIFLKHSYINYFHNNLIDWLSWMEVERRTVYLLENSNVEKLMLSNTLSMNDLNELIKQAPKNANYLKNEKIATLIFDKKLSIAELKCSSYEKLSRLASEGQDINYRFFTHGQSSNSRDTTHYRAKY